MPCRESPSQRFRYCPPFPWRGPRPIVEAFRATEMTTLTLGNRTYSLGKGDWFIETSDGGVETMCHETFRKWYDPIDEAAAAALAGIRRQRGPRRSVRRRDKTNGQRQLKL